MSGWSESARGMLVGRVFGWICRVLLALSFIPFGLKKVLGEPFTILPPESGVVGYFFDALYQTGFYYNFLGWGQLIFGGLDF